MDKLVPSWLKALYHHLKLSSFVDLRVVGANQAYLYSHQTYEQVPPTILAKYFASDTDFEEALRQLAWDLELRFDAYHPYLCQDIPNIGRLTIIKGAILGQGSQLFLRLLSHTADDLLFIDKLKLLPVFQKNFTRYPWLICGASGVGKTTLLFAELSKHFAHQPVIFMDKFQERPYLHPMWVFLREQSTQSNDRGRVSSHHLLDLAFKLGANTLVFGEIRREELPPFFHGIFSGHKHIYGTFHADSQEALWTRMSLLREQSDTWAKKNVAALFLEKQGKAYTIKDLYIPAK
ncbi:MAG: ATPase, T2SS/T4P/T4SS family [Proteobacteria bacterium]|nr:ATPase, T2SS/T4P/T4SS family [Pseudomonadota bacterium]